jgi:hypothetical protein
MSRATYTVAIGWAAKAANVFTLGVSTLGGTDTLGGYFGAVDYDDVTPDVKTISIQRGRTSDMGPQAAGVCTLTLKDSTGKYNPANASSPLYGNLVPMRRVRVSATLNGTTYRRFNGFIRRIEPNITPTSKEAVIECVDLMIWLDRAKPVIAATGPTTTGAAIGLLLDAIGWTETAYRDLDVGDPIPDFEADGSKTALQLINALLDTERGRFYVSGAGIATYEDRYAPYRAPRTSAQSTVSGGMSAAMPSVDLDAIINRATVTRDETDADAQVATDAASIYQYGLGDGPSITTGYLPDDAQAYRLAEYIVWLGKDPREAVRAVSLVNRDDATLAAMLARDLGDRVSIGETLAGTSLDGHIESIDEQIRAAGTEHRVTWRVSKRVTPEPFIIGSSTLGGANVITY